jgi:hypothetical protein
MTPLNEGVPVLQNTAQGRPVHKRITSLTVVIQTLVHENDISGTEEDAIQSKDIFINLPDRQNDGIGFPNTHRE